MFTNKAKFDQATEAHHKKNIGQQVHHLCIQEMNHDAELVSVLPTVFPKVRFLKLDSQLLREYTDDDFQVRATNWKNVETIVDCHYMMNATMYLLKLMTFDNLTSLELTCVPDRASIVGQRERTRALIEGIHNAPSLEKLDLQDTVLKIEDAEYIRTKNQN